MTDEEKKQAREAAEKMYPLFKEPQKHAGFLQGFAYRSRISEAVPVPPLNDDRLDARAEVLVKGAAAAIKAKPENLNAILHQLYAQAFTDFEIFSKGDRLDARGDTVRTYERTFPAWNPPMGSTRK